MDACRYPCSWRNACHPGIPSCDFYLHPNFRGFALFVSFATSRLERVIASASVTRPSITLTSSSTVTYSPQIVAATASDAGILPSASSTRPTTFPTSDSAARPSPTIAATSASDAGARPAISRLRCRRSFRVDLCRQRAVETV